MVFIIYIIYANVENIGSVEFSTYSRRCLLSSGEVPHHLTVHIRLLHNLVIPVDGELLCLKLDHVGNVGVLLHYLQSVVRLVVVVIQEVQQIWHINDGLFLELLVWFQVILLPLPGLDLLAEDETFLEEEHVAGTKERFEKM